MAPDRRPPPVEPSHSSFPSPHNRRRWIEKADDGARALLPECSHAGHVLALYLATRGDLVVVGASSGMACLPAGWLCATACSRRHVLLLPLLVAAAATATAAGVFLLLPMRRHSLHRRRSI